MLLAKDLSVAPLYLMRGRPPEEQTIILYIWEHGLRGDEKVTKKAISRDAGMTPAKLNKTCAKLVEEGVLAEEGRFYACRCTFVPTRTQTEPEVKKKKSIPAWARDAHGIWAEHRGGFLNLRSIDHALSIAVMTHGPQKVLDALIDYAQSTQPWDTFSKFPEKLGEWLREEPEPAQGFKDLL